MKLLYSVFIPNPKHSIVPIDRTLNNPSMSRHHMERKKSKHGLRKFCMFLVKGCCRSVNASAVDISTDQPLDQSQDAFINESDEETDENMRMRDEQLRVIPVLERLIKTHPVWYLPNIGRVGAAHLLRNRDVGTFIVRKSSQNDTMALSVRLAPPGEHIEHYLIESKDEGLQLEGSNHFFPAIPVLIAYYVENLDELPCKLVLPPVILQATTHQELASLALLGQDFWTSPLTQGKNLQSPTRKNVSSPTQETKTEKSFSPVNFEKVIPVERVQVKTHNQLEAAKNTPQKAPRVIRATRKMHVPKTVDNRLVEDRQACKSFISTASIKLNKTMCNESPAPPPPPKIHVDRGTNHGALYTQPEKKTVAMETSTHLTVPKQGRVAALQDGEMTPDSPAYYHSNLSDRLSDYEDVWSSPSPARKTGKAGKFFSEKVVENNETNTHYIDKNKNANLGFVNPFFQHESIKKQKQTPQVAINPLFNGTSTSSIQTTHMHSEKTEKYRSEITIGIPNRQAPMVLHVDVGNSLQKLQNQESVKISPNRPPPVFVAPPPPPAIEGAQPTCSSAPKIRIELRQASQQTSVKQERTFFSTNVGQPTFSPPSSRADSPGNVTSPTYAEPYDSLLGQPEHSQHVKTIVSSTTTTALTHQQTQTSPSPFKPIEENNEEFSKTECVPSTVETVASKDVETRHLNERQCTSSPLSMPSPTKQSVLRSASRSPATVSIDSIDRKDGTTEKVQKQRLSQMNMKNATCSNQPLKTDFPTNNERLSILDEKYLQNTQECKPDNKFPVINNSRSSSFSDVTTVEDMIVSSSPELKLRPIGQLTLDNIKRMSTYDNVPDPYNRRNSMASSVSGTVFSKPWDSSLWDNLLNLGGVLPHHRGRLDTGESISTVDGFHGRNRYYHGNNQEARSVSMVMVPESTYDNAQSSDGEHAHMNWEDNAWNQTLMSKNDENLLCGVMETESVHSWKAVSLSNDNEFFLKPISMQDLNGHHTNKRSPSTRNSSIQKCDRASLRDRSPPKHQPECSTVRKPLRLINGMLVDENEDTMATDENEFNIDVSDEDDDDLDVEQRMRHPTVGESFNERLKPFLSAKRLTRMRQSHRDPGIRIRDYIYRLSMDRNTTFGSTIENFIQCTKESNESNPHVVMRNVRQFMSGIKNYLVKHGEGNLEDIIEKERKKLESTEFLNIDAIIEGALHRCVIKPLKQHIYKLFVSDYTQNGNIKRLADNIKYASTKSPEEMGIRSDLQPPSGTSMEVIKHFLNKMQKAYSPIKKLENLLGATSSIYNSVKGLPSSTGSRSTTSLGADDFLPMFIYILVQCGLVSAEVEADYMWGLLHSSLLAGEGGYYLTTLSSAVHVLKNLREMQEQSLETLRRNGLQDRLPSISDLQGFLKIVIPDENNDSIISKTLPVRPNMMTKEVRSMIAHKFKITNPQDYGLYLLCNGKELQLSDTDCPQNLKADLLVEEQKCAFAYKRNGAKIAWPNSLLCS